jgi:O-antigen/teichoic acid export membrane protein
LFAGFEYAEAALPLVIISMGTLVGTLGIAVSPILMTLERTIIVSVLSLISVILSVVLSIFALAALGLGMVGTAWARAFAGIISLGLCIYVLNRYVKISFDKEALWKASAASIFMVLAIIAADSFRGLLSPISYQFLVFRLNLLPVYVVIGALAYFFGLIVFKAIKKYDVELFQEYLPKGFRRIASLLERIARVE